MQKDLFVSILVFIAIRAGKLPLSLSIRHYSDQAVFAVSRSMYSHQPRQANHVSAPAV